MNHIIDKSLTRSTTRSQFDFQAFRQPEQFGLLLSIHWRDDPMVIRYHAIDNDGNVMDFVDLETMIVSEHVMERALELMKQMEGQEVVKVQVIKDCSDSPYERSYSSLPLRNIEDFKKL